VQENDRIPATNRDVTHLTVMDAYATTGMIVFGRNPVRHGSNPLAKAPGNGGLELVAIPEINALQPIQFGGELFVDAEPAGFLIGAQREFCRAWPNQQRVLVKGSHFLQEEAPDEVGAAIAGFVSRVLAGQIQMMASAPMNAELRRKGPKTAVPTGRVLTGTRYYPLHLSLVCRSSVSIDLA
jgi:hypothetical protein